jgi:hypothetical protein
LLRSRFLTVRVATAIELLAVYTCILLYIWRWQRPHPLAWIPILLFVLSSHVFHKDTLREMGLTAHQIGASARLIFPIAAVIYGCVAAWALATHRIPVGWPRAAGLERFGSYAVWCCFQQYLMQCYFYRRLRTVLVSPHWSAVIVALMFGGAHIPNLVLMIATTLGGVILSEVFARHPNIWPLALTQAIGGMLIGAVSPPSLIHQMRVGPGFYQWSRGNLTPSRL